MQYRKILVPVDVAEPKLGRPAIETAVEMVKDTGGTVRLINVLALTPVMLAEYVPPDFDTQQRSAAETALKEIAASAELPHTQLTTVIRQGGIYHEILEEAKTMQADLIVMTSHRPAMRSYFLGSNAGHVVRYAPCSVFVVRR